MMVPVPGFQPVGAWPNALAPAGAHAPPLPLAGTPACAGAAVCAEVAAPDMPLLEFELAIATPPTATANAAAPAAMDLVTLLENIENTPCWFDSKTNRREAG